MCPILMLAISVFALHSVIAQMTEFKEANASSSICNTLGCDLVLECTITGIGATIWQGTIFDGCQNDDIVLRHSEFTSGRLINETCSNGRSIIAHTILAENGSFTSQLRTIITENLTNTTIECANESGHVVGRKHTTDLDVCDNFGSPSKECDKMESEDNNVTSLAITSISIANNNVTSLAITSVSIAINKTEPVGEAKLSTEVLSITSIGLLVILLTVLAAIILITVMVRRKCKSQVKVNVSELPSDYSNTPRSVLNDNLMDLGQYSLLQHKTNEEGMTYIKIGPNTNSRNDFISDDKDRVEYVELNHNTQLQIFDSDADKYLNLDNLLIQVRRQVTPLWHQFGVVAGVPRGTLNKCLNYPPEESIVEVLDHWLRQSKKNWRDVAYVLNEIGLQELAENTLQVYNTGLLPTAVANEDIDTVIPHITSERSNTAISEEREQSPPPLPPKYCNSMND